MGDSELNNTNSAMEPEETPITKKPRSIKRFSLSTTMIIQIVAAFFLLITVNYLMHKYGKQVDLTKRSSFTLRDETKKNLSSDLVSKRARPIRIIAVINPSHFKSLQLKTNESVVSRINAKLQEYKDNSSGKIEIETVNPVIDHGRLRELSEEFGRTFADSELIIDARYSLTPPKLWMEEAKAAQPNETEDAITQRFKQKSVAENVRYLPISQLFVSHYDPVYKRHFIKTWKDETEITTNLLRAVEGKPKTIYFPYDKCRVEPKVGQKAPWEEVKKFYQNQNINLQNIEFSELTEIIFDPVRRHQIDGIALIAPNVDFTQTELEALKQYWQRTEKASMLILTDPDENHLPNLYNYLWTSSGVRPRKDRLIKLDNKQLMVDPEVSILPGPEVNGNLSNNSTIFDGSSQSIEVRGEHDQEVRGTLVEPFPLIKAKEGWWGETRFGRKNPSYDEKEDSPNPLYLAAAVTRGSLNDQLKAPLVSKMVIIGNSDFMSPRNIRQEHITYMSQVGNWLVGREELLNIAQEENIPSKVFIAEGHVDILNNIFLFFLPCGALLLTGFVWNIRRS